MKLMALYERDSCEYERRDCSKIFPRELFILNNQFSFIDFLKRYSLSVEILHNLQKKKNYMQFFFFSLGCKKRYSSSQHSQSTITEQKYFLANFYKFLNKKYYV